MHGWTGRQTAMVNDQMMLLFLEAVLSSLFLPRLLQCSSGSAGVLLASCRVTYYWTVISRLHLCPDEVDLIITSPDFDIRNSVIHSLRVVILWAFWLMADTRIHSGIRHNGWEGSYIMIHIWFINILFWGNHYIQCIFLTFFFLLIIIPFISYLVSFFFIHCSIFYATHVFFPQMFFQCQFIIDLYHPYKSGFQLRSFYIT